MGRGRGCFFFGGGGGRPPHQIFATPPPPGSPTNFGQLRFLGAAREIWAKSVFKEVSKLFYYFEEIDILYFNLKSAW